ncbi:CCA tRNA nucleotidyltransferase 1, mitochondrial-like [Paramacrobiotus metropolitanus]|uniref:CCA tRNA nucleotidyltransferase 1, mitochondrial-like n=1 Tax=Paramacrobiotus metropolitanus TaxID=2943436 RepID=UPI0024464FA3|nr:CCA tRNA nucleotidyltransferase 1, mitochondrial-like [Paramacrobiotus metropolitanus]
MRVSTRVLSILSVNIPKFKFRYKSQCGVNQSVRPLCRSSMCLQSALNRINMAESVKITSPVFRSLFTPELESLASIFREYGYELRIAGGAVRDILMNIRPEDVDFATTATPVDMKKMFDEKLIRMINAGGEKHGTVTARINDKENFEVTTLRIDKTTDGRWAQVEFTTDWVLDARRRDLTINSMFLDLDGNLYDYFSGMQDLMQHRIRFVDDPRKRIQEDFLRILRYFRFYGRICPDADNHDSDTLEAIRENADGLQRISGERIWMELRKILTGRHGNHLVSRMVDLGLTRYMGFPEKPNVEELFAVWKRCHEFQPKPATILASLLASQEEVEKLDERLRLSNEECATVLFIIDHRSNPDLLDYCRKYPDVNALVPYQHLVAETALTCKQSDARSRCIELLKYRGDGVLVQGMENWEIPPFPVKATMLIEKGHQGPIVGMALDYLRREWIRSTFTKTVDDLLLNDLPKAMHQLEIQLAERPKNKKVKR